MTLLFDRQYRLEVIDAASGQGTTWSSAGVQRPLQIQFEITRTQSPAPNTARISITNLSPESARAIERPGQVLRLFAGYGEDLALLFEGDIAQKSVRTRKPAETRVTTLEAGERETALVSTRSALSYGANASARTILGALASELGVTLDVSDDIASRTFRAGYSFIGMARDAISEVVAGLDAGWTIQDGVLHVLERTGVSTVLEGVELTPGTGLVGSPELVQGGVAFKAKLIPRIKPKAPVRIISPSLSGTYVITQVTYRGDLESPSSWIVDAQGSLAVGVVTNTFATAGEALVNALARAFTSPFQA